MPTAQCVRPDEVLRDEILAVSSEIYASDRNNVKKKIWVDTEARDEYR